jgi:exopolysaccharide biosynthesis polyprenyl glycosylphosphotransferase
MTRRLRVTLNATYRAFDLMCGLSLLAAFAFASTGRLPTGVAGFLAERLTIRHVVLVTMFVGLWHGVFALAGLHGRCARIRTADLLSAVLRATTLGTLPLLIFSWTSRGSLSGSLVVILWLTVTAVEFVGRAAIGLAARLVRRSSSGSVRLLIVGSGPRAARLLQKIQDAQLTQYELLGFIDRSGRHTVPDQVARRMVGSLGELEDYLAANVVDEVLVTLPVRSCYSDIQSVISTCERVGVEVHYLADVFAVERATASHDDAADIRAVRLTHVVQDYRLVVKRAVDIVGASVGLVVLAPVLLVCSLLVWLSGAGPVFFAQQRYGFNRRTFTMFKFRTMVADAAQRQSSLESLNEAAGPIFKIKHDPRITPVGRLLRKTSLDELPQLLNVLRGEMSLVGPRPMAMRDVSRFTEAALMRRFSVTPGLTCLWQVSGRSNTSFDTWVELDLAYIDNWSLTLDAQILLKTVPAVLSGAGAM